MGTERDRNRKVAIVSAIDTTLKFLLSAQMKAAQEAGFTVYGVCTKGPNFAFLRQQGYKMYAIPIKRTISPFSDLIALWKMYGYFKREKIDIVHTHTPKCSLLGQLAAKFAGVPIIVNTVHGFYFHDNMGALKRWFYIAVEWIAGKCSTAILSQNPEDIETAVKLGICKRDKIKLLGNGVDLAKFDPTKFGNDFKKKKRIEIGIPEGAITVGIIGRLVKEKGYLELFQAMNQLMARYENLWLVIIGQEDVEKKDKISSDTFRRYGISDRTVYLGKRDDIPELLACLDIFGLPSWREGFPRSAIEAAAMGLPIIATNIRGCRQVVDDGLNGILVSFKDVDELVEAISKLVKNYELRRQMGESGYQKAQKEFDENKVCEIVLGTYNRLLIRKLAGCISKNSDINNV